MQHIFHLLFILNFSSCVTSQSLPPIIGTYEYVKSGPFFPIHEYDAYTIGEKKIAYRSGRSGVGHHSWKGFYVRQDSVLDVLVYFDFYMDGNIGLTSAETRQGRIRLTVRRDGDQVFLIRKNTPMSGDTLPNIHFSAPATEIYAQTSDSVTFYPPPAIDCEHYGNNRIQFRGLQKYGLDSTQVAEQMLYDLLTNHLNAVLDTITINPHLRRIATATALLKTNTLSSFFLPEVTIVDNSTPYTMNQLMTSFKSFRAKRLRAFNDPHLQDYLLVVLAVTEDGVCILPPYRRVFLSNH